MPYKIPSLEVSSDETNGKVVDNGSVFMFVATANSSLPNGKVELKALFHLQNACWQSPT